MSEPHEHLSAKPEWLRELRRRVEQISQEVVPADFTGNVRFNYLEESVKDVNLYLSDKAGTE